MNSITQTKKCIHWFARTRKTLAMISNILVWELHAWKKDLKILTLYSIDIAPDYRIELAPANGLAHFKDTLPILFECLQAKFLYCLHLHVLLSKNMDSLDTLILNLMVGHDFTYA
jgi:hypothetical protein